MTTSPDDDEPDDREREPTTDDILETARDGQQFVTRPESVGPAIGSDRIIRVELPDAVPVRQVYRLLNGKLVGKWCNGAEPLTPEQWAEVGVELADQMERAQHATRHDKWLEWGPDEWRQIRGFRSYEMNGYTREVRRTLKNGTVKPVTARKSSVTLSRPGEKPTGHGIEKLWRLTFPEYVVDKNSWQMHSLRREYIPAELGRVIEKP